MISLNNQNKIRFNTEMRIEYRLNHCVKYREPISRLWSNNQGSIFTQYEVKCGLICGKKIVKSQDAAWRS